MEGDCHDLTVDARKRMIAAADRALKWRRDKIMIARLTFFWTSWFIGGKKPDWHSLFDCEKCGHHPLRATWIGPYDLTDSIDTSGRFGS